MKKILLSLIAVTLGVAGLSAQSTVTNNPRNKAYFGVRASLDVTCPGDFEYDDISADLSDPGFGFSAGAVYNIPVYMNLYFEPGLKIYYNTTKLKDLDDFDGSLREWGFRIPFSIGCHFDFRPCKLFVYSGPELNVGLHGRIHETSSEGRVTYKSSTDMYDSFNRVSLGVLLGAGLQVDNYYFSIEGSFDVTDRMKDDGKWHDNRFSLSLGYNF